jgi:hypothetical protein
VWAAVDSIPDARDMEAAAVDLVALLLEGYAKPAPLLHGVALSLVAAGGVSPWPSSGRRGERIAVEAFVAEICTARALGSRVRKGF